MKSLVPCQGIAVAFSDDDTSGTLLSATTALNPFNCMTRIDYSITQDSSVFRNVRCKRALS